LEFLERGEELEGLIGDGLHLFAAHNAQASEGGREEAADGHRQNCCRASDAEEL